MFNNLPVSTNKKAVFRLGINISTTRRQRQVMLTTTLFDFIDQHLLGSPSATGALAAPDAPLGAAQRHSAAS